MGVIFFVLEFYEWVINKGDKFFDFKSLKIFVNVFRKKWEGGRKILLFLVCVGVVVILIILGFGGVIVLFVMRSFFCFGFKFVGYFLVYRMFVFGVGGFFGVKFLRKFFSEVIIIVILIVN